ncbi:MAG: hypothetical protein QXS93_00885 [Candidatus Micrarchaeia archaeon]
MRVTGIIPIETTRHMHKSNLARLLPLTDIIEAQHAACDFVSGWQMPAHLKIYYRCSHELAMGKKSVAYYNYIGNKPSRRRIVVFIDKMVRRLYRTKSKEPYKVYLGGVLVHEFCHVRDYSNRFPIVFKQYQPLQNEEDKMLTYIYDFICEAHAEEQCTSFIQKYSPTYKPLSIFKLYRELLTEFKSPMYIYRKITRLINVCRLILGDGWFYKVALNPPDFDDLSHPEEYAEWLGGI